MGRGRCLVSGGVVVRAEWGERRRAAKVRKSETEWALAESTERYRSLFDYNPHAAFSLDLAGRFTDANEVAQRLSGYTLAELSELDFTHLIRDEHVPRTIEAFEAAVGRVPQQLEATMEQKDGAILELNLTAVPVVVHGEVVGVHGVAEDVTERNEMRRELERTRRAAEEASAAKSLFLANMSHEVRTPLTSVLGATEMLAEDDLDPSQHYLVGIIHRSGERLLRLVNDILDVSRLEAGTVDVQRAPMNVRSLVDDVLAWAKPLADREGLTFQWHVDPALPETVTGDAMRISQVLTNLLGNAFKFTEEGQVSLLVDVVGSRAGVVEVRFAVEDTGIGILDDQLSTLFQSFTQVDTSTTRKYGGAGLGLAICQELVSLMGGHLGAESTEGVGSTFLCTLPLSVEG
jgi:PAS domain S-box-containing protein